ncbi:dephospho-CoA kinase [Geomicrobium halophilum]|uniref:Dephospho-CoA kinase n=1 Tax=Geomicrobium halophilum TaxID=549000 RepID=A0A841PKJ9_9BACL|nr:dephospho-CoA kinase [Geomicrobium halophilum]MBB6448204.1 dephospho-CoA kinase [Geomicrobium halophilum]
MIIGLTGGIASGKSLLAQYLNDWGFPIVDADVIAREVVEPGKPVYKQLQSFFGEEIFHGDGTLDRKALGRIVFSDQEKRDQLNQMMHPAINEEMMRQKEDLIAQGHKTLVFDIPLLVENGRTNIVDYVLLAYVEEDVQLKRLMERDRSSEEEALSRIRSQMPLEKKRNHADAIVDNSGHRKTSKEQLAHILAEWGIDVNV